MKTDEYYKFTKGFFEAFKWEVIALKNQTHTELLRYQFDDIDTETLMKKLNRSCCQDGRIPFNTS